MLFVWRYDSIHYIFVVLQSAKLNKSIIAGATPIENPLSILADCRGFLFLF